MAGITFIYTFEWTYRYIYINQDQTIKKVYFHILFKAYFNIDAVHISGIYELHICKQIIICSQLLLIIIVIGHNNYTF